MSSIKPEELRQLLNTVKERGEQIAQRKQEIDTLRRAMWVRIDLLRQDGALGPPRVERTPSPGEADPRHAPHVQVYPACVAQDQPAGAYAAATSAAPAHEAAPERAPNEELAPAV